MCKYQINITVIIVVLNSSIASTAVIQLKLGPDLWQDCITVLRLKIYIKDLEVF